MDIRESLSDLRGRQADLLAELDGLMAEVTASDVLRENELLRKLGEERAVLIASLEDTNRQLNAENQALKLSLRERIIGYRLELAKWGLLGLNSSKNDAWDEYRRHQATLLSEAITRVERMKREALDELAADGDGIRSELDRLTLELQTRLGQRRAELSRGLSEEPSRLEAGLRKAGADVSEAALLAGVGRSRIEMAIGLNWLNRVGIFLLLLAVGLFARHTYMNWFSDTVKCIAIFALGGVLGAVGQVSHRRGMGAFAEGLLGGAMGVFYAAIFYGYFVFHLFSLGPALALSAIVTGSTVAVSILNRQQAICGLGLIGGYLPLVSYIAHFGLNDAGYLAAIGYVCLLNLVVLTVSLFERWDKVHYLSFVMNVPALVYLATGAPGVAAGIAYACIAFGAYLGVTLAYPLLHGKGLQLADVALLGANTVVSSGVLFHLFEVGGLDEYRGLLAALLCGVFLALFLLARRLLPAERYTQLLFSSISIAFAVLAVPMQFGVHWAALGWLIEAVVLILVGLWKAQVRLEKSGWAILALCLAFFYLGDLLGLLGASRIRDFDLKSTSVALGLVLVAAAYLRALAAGGRSWLLDRPALVHQFKLFVIWNVWLYLAYVSGRAVDVWAHAGALTAFYREALFVAVTACTAFIAPRVPLVGDKQVRDSATLLNVVAALTCVHLNSNSFVRGSEIAMASLLACNFLVLGGLSSSCRMASKGTPYAPHHREALGVGLLAYFLVDLTVFLAVQFDLRLTSAWLSSAYLLTSVGAVCAGFALRLGYLRRCGLALALAATAKMCFIDGASLDPIYRVASFFGFGVVLIGLSYIYQRVEKAYGNRKD